tara:strand:- start:5711 stop:5935 length:225 start_codon:yes stop_codon:yes gene_type:complete
MANEYAVKASVDYRINLKISLASAIQNRDFYAAQVDALTLELTAADTGIDELAVTIGQPIDKEAPVEIAPVLIV